MLRVQNLTKRFGHVTAISNVSANIRKGRVTALLGDNGAGKSTLVKMICGTYKPTQGSVWVNGKQVHMDSARDALALGITAVYQDLALVDQRNVIHNISLGNIPTKWGGLVVDRKKMRETAENALSYMKAKLPSLDIPVSSMSGGQRQAVAIARACASGGQLVIMDEPTAALGIREQRMVLDVVHDLRAHGTSVLIISHNLDHVFEVADDLLILRGGRVVAEVERNAVSHDEVVCLILAGQPRDADLEEEVAA
ncbi:ATP-binding cassette domain-containing protein [Sinorhizobium meliloti]|uniref:ATP-binding cassette domain-containing protein n=1 Tax=Rhizobium meliloti TaxID=382 RepID=UPI000FDBB8BD|nr:ATP-binding cassette domain-containing protein [Sinorhizobium meliloti]RVG54814.1 sugar ABC transporter ATP-binding protein [Sinorhizobium meliloti]